MRVINAFKIALGNFGLIFKNILYKAILFVVFAAGLYVTLRISLKPMLENLAPVLKDIADIVKSLVQNQKAFTANGTDSPLIADFQVFINGIVSHFANIVWAVVICILIIYLYRIFSGVSNSTMLIMIDEHMSSLSHRPYLSVMFENLRKIIRFQLIDAMIAIVYYALVAAVVFVIVYLVAPFVPLVAVFLGVSVLTFAVTIYSTCMSQVSTKMIIGGMKAKEAFKKGLFPSKEYFWKMFSAYLSVTMLYVYLAVSMLFFTLGVGTVIISSFYALMISCMRLVDNYTINKKKYFIDYDNIIVPKELRENDEQLLNKVDI